MQSACTLCGGSSHPPCQHTPGKDISASVGSYTPESSFPNSPKEQTGSTFANKAGDIGWKQQEELLGYSSWTWLHQGIGRKAGCYLVPSRTVSGWSCCFCWLPRRTSELSHNNQILPPWCPGEPRSWPLLPASAASATGPGERASENRVRTWLRTGVLTWC